MNTALRKKSLLAAGRWPEEHELSLETQELLTLGEREGWPVQILGWAPMPQGVVQVGDYILSPAEIDSSQVPARAVARIETICRAGLSPRLVIVHEAPKLLPSPAAHSGQGGAAPQPSSALKWIGAVACVLAVAVGALLGIVMIALAVVALVGALMVPLALLALAAGVDPILVAVTDEDCWIAIDFWQTEVP